eukprot:TRINITY_DN1096_c0_g1_i1.p1 TRINITY_DN1096_c0_g1~~TRINITY_DN1096_c0_g1_i1.p1  ORF type:complete len:1297 (+),score=217.97 TRINITY_DN1096_c0_g1_i1:10066-13956(+)
MPCNSKGHIMLPHSENPFELWPALLTKAILKLYSYQWVYKDNSEGEVGDASIVHALTGLLPERIDMGNFQSEKWPLLKRLLSDDHYFNKKTYVCGYCLTDYNPTLPSIAKYIKPEDKSGVEGTDSNAPATSGSRTLLKLKKFANFALSVTTGKKLKEGTKERPANVVKGFGYALMDCFENEGFDMLYAVKEDRDMVVEKTSPYSPEKRKKRRIIGADDGKKKLKDSDTVSRKSSRMGKKQIRKFQFVKIKSSVGKIPVMNAVCPFTNDEITMAKKCMLNRWEKPPDYDKRKQKFELEIRKGDPKDSFYSNEKEEKFSEEGKKDQEGAETIREEGDDENYKGDHGAVEPKTRAPGGLWMEAGDLAHCFQYLLVFHNPRLYSSKVCQKDLWADANELFIPNEDKMYMAIKPGTPEEEEKNRAVISDEFKDLPIDWEYEKSKVLITFAPNGCLLKKGEPATNYSCTIPGLGIKLTSYLSSKLVNVKEINGQLAFQPNIIAPFGYSLWVMSNYATVSKVPELEYLCSPEKGYIKKEVEIETPQLKQNRYYVLFRFNFTTKDPSTECILKLGITDRYLLECMRFHVVNQIQPGAPDGKIKEAELFQGGTITIQHNTAFSLTSGSYSLICDIMAPYNVEATKIKVALATLPEVTDFTNIELEEQAEYGDLYTPYKYGMIFRERVYVGGETPVSMHVRLRKGGYVKPPPAKEEKKGGKKEPEEKPVVVQEKDLDPPRRIKVEIMEDGEVIYEKMSYNHISIPHMKLRKTEDAGDKKTKNTYIIQCGFDISDWPECVQKCDETNDINWVLKVVSPGSVSIVKDTEKADKEQAIKESWEAAEPGRTEKGKQSRARFLALQKKLKGEELTEQEQELLKEPSQRKEEDNKKPAAGQAKKPPAKEVKKQPGKGGVPVKSEEEVGQVLDLTKPLPEPQEHVNQDIKAYLEHAKKERLIVLKDTKHKAKTRGLTEIEQIKQKQEGEMEAFEKYYKEKKEKDELEKKEREDQKAKFQQGLAAELTETVAGFKTILQKRAEYKEVLINRKSKEDELVKMIAADKIDVQVFLNQLKKHQQQLNKLIEEAKKYKVKEEVIEEGIKMAEKCNYSKSIEDQLVKALADKNWAVAKELYTKATTQQLKMDPKMLNDCKNQLAKQKMLQTLQIYSSLSNLSLTYLHGNITIGITQIQYKKQQQKDVSKIFKFGQRFEGIFQITRYNADDINSRKCMNFVMDVGSIRVDSSGTVKRAASICVTKGILGSTYINYIWFAEILTQITICIGQAGQNTLKIPKKRYKQACGQYSQLALQAKK